MQGLGAFIITFRRPEHLQSTFAAIAGQTTPPEYLIVFDNAADDAVRQFVSAAAADFPGSLLYDTVGKNLGPAGAALRCINKLLDLGCEYIHWIDDDDPPLQRDITERLVRTLTSSPDIGCVGTAGNYFDWKRGQVGRIEEAALAADVIDVDMVAGCNDMVLARRPLEAGILPNADLFFGYEDWDVCWRMKRAGFRVVVDAPLLREQRASTTPRGITRFWEKKSIEVNEWRVYLAQRNFAYLMLHEYQAYGALARHVAKELGKCLFVIVRISPRKGFKLLRVTLRAWTAGARRRLGPRDPDLVRRETATGGAQTVYASMKRKARG